MTGKQYALPIKLYFVCTAIFLLSLGVVVNSVTVADAAADNDDDKMSDSTATMQNTDVNATSVNDDELSGVIVIGSILPLSGNLASVGEEMRTATELGRDDFNEYLAQKGSNWSLEIAFRDSQTDEDISLQKLKLLHQNSNVDVVIGPITSSNLKNMQDYSNANGMLLFSCCSTAAELAIADDNVFRLVHDDSETGIAFGKVLSDAGIQVTIPIWRNDIWGTGMEKIVRDSLESKGGIVDTGISYDTDDSHFADDALALAGIVEEYVNEYPPEKIAVLLLGFSEGAQVIEFAATHDILDKVRWFSADGNTYPELIDNSIKRQFVADTMLTTIEFTSDKNDVTTHVVDSLTEILERAPSNYANAEYDIVWIIGKAMERTQSTDVQMLSEAIPEVAKDSKGALGNIRLNDAGDLTPNKYNILTFIDDQWVIQGVYDTLSDTVVMGDKMAESNMCKSNLVPVLKYDESGYACVKPATAEELILRGWAK